MYFSGTTLSRRVMIDQIDPMPVIYIESIILDGLDEYEVFSMQIQPFNAQGIGPISVSFSGTTAEDGK